MIVKVQVPILTLPTKKGSDSDDGSPVALALIYSKDKKVAAQVPVSSPLLARMDGKKKAFFHAVVRRGTIEIGEVAPWQDW